MTSGRKSGNTKTRVTCENETSEVIWVKVGTKVFLYLYLFVIVFLKGS